MSLLPFVNSQSDLKLLDHVLPVDIIRVTPNTIAQLPQHIVDNHRIWLDTFVDGIGNHPNSPELVQQYHHYDLISSHSFHEKPNKNIVEEFVTEILDAAKDNNADIISVPQLPIPNDTSSNRINRALATATGSWKVKSGYDGQLVLPVILKKPTQLDKKAHRDIATNSASKAFSLSNSHGLWVAIAGLSDFSYTPQLATTRFTNLIRLHDEINNKVPNSDFRIGGPYWALNLILWARGAITHAATGLGNAYSYQIPGSHLTAGNTRIALPPFRRTAVVNSDLRYWLENASNTLDKTSSLHNSLSNILANLNTYEDDSLAARKQIVKFYRDWFRSFENIKDTGRQLALYQDFSSVYVTGRTSNLPILTENGSLKRAEWHSQVFMNLCLVA